MICFLSMGIVSPQNDDSKKKDGQSPDQQVFLQPVAIVFFCSSQFLLTLRVIKINVLKLLCLFGIEKTIFYPDDQVLIFNYTVTYTDFLVKISHRGIRSK